MKKFFGIGLATAGMFALGMAFGSASSEAACRNQGASCSAARNYCAAACRPDNRNLDRSPEACRAYCNRGYSGCMSSGYWVTDNCNRGPLQRK